MDTESKHTSSIELPLWIISTIACFFVTYLGKTILVPFIAAIFLTYLLKPIVSLLTTPFVKCCPCFIQSQCRWLVICSRESIKRKIKHKKRSERMKTTRKMEKIHSVDIEKDGTESEILLHTNRKKTIKSEKEDKDYRLRRCPRSISVILALIVATAVITALSFMLTNSIQRFEAEHWPAYKRQGQLLVNQLLLWMYTRLHMDGSVILQELKSDFPISDTLNQLVLWTFSAVSDFFWVLLFVVYLLFEEAVPQSPLRNKIDMQIQAYIGLKTLISCFVGFVIYIILGPILNVRMAGPLGVLTFFFNYIPNWDLSLLHCYQYH